MWMILTGTTTSGRLVKNCSGEWIESEEDRRERLASYRDAIYRYTRGPHCPKCLWPFPNSKHVCLGHDTHPMDADWGA